MHQLMHRSIYLLLIGFYLFTLRSNYPFILRSSSSLLMVLSI